MSSLVNSMFCIINVTFLDTTWYFWLCIISTWSYIAIRKPEFVYTKNLGFGLWHFWQKKPIFPVFSIFSTCHYSTAVSSTLLVKIACHKVGTNRHFQASWASHDMAFGLETVLSRPLLEAFSTYHFQMTSPFVLPPERHLLAQKHIVRAIKHDNLSSGMTWAHAWEN